MNRNDLRKQLGLASSYATQLARMAESIRDRADRAQVRLQNGSPVGDIPCLSASDLPDLAARLIRTDGRIEALMFHLYEAEEDERKAG